MGFWREHLKGYRHPLAFAPSMGPGSPPPGPRRLATHHGEMPPAWMEAAQRLCRARRITLNTLCQGAFALLLAVAMFPLKAMTIEGTTTGTLAEARELLDLVRARKIEPPPIVERRLEQASATLDDLRAGKIVGRAILAV